MYRLTQVQTVSRTSAVVWWQQKPGSFLTLFSSSQQHRSRWLLWLPPSAGMEQGTAECVPVPLKGTILKLHKQLLTNHVGT